MKKKIVTLDNKTISTDSKAGRGSPGSVFIQGKVKVVYGGQTNKPFCMGCGLELYPPEIIRRRCMVCKISIVLPGEYIVKKHASGWFNKKALEFADK